MPDKPITPWYRQRWPWILIALQIMGISMASITAYQAVKHQDQVIERPDQKALSKTSHMENHNQ